jgi:hypothetical protein
MAVPVPPGKWRRSTRCDADHCVEVAFAKGKVLLRNSRQPTGPVLTFTVDQWRDFCDALASGDFTPANH